MMSKETRVAWRSRIFLGAWVLYAGYYTCRKDVGVATGSDVLHIAHVLSLFGAAYALGQLAGGALADRIGGRRIAIAGAWISIACTLLLAKSSHPAQILALQLGNGFGQGFGWPSILKLIGAWFKNNERDRVLGWWSASYILGGFLATSLTAWLIAHSNSIPGTHMVYLVPALLLCMAALFFQKETTEVPGSDFAKPPANPKQELLAWRRITQSGDIRRICGMYFFLKMTRYTLLFWLPLYLTTGLDYSAYRAAHTASWFELCGFLGPIMIGYASEKWFSTRRFALGAGIMFLLAFVCLLHPMLVDSGWFGLIVSISLMGILIHGADLLMSGMAVLAAVPDELHGRAVGLVNAVGSVGQLLSPLLVTFFVSRMGWTKLFDLFVFFALAAGTICASTMRAKTGGTPRTNRSVLETSKMPL